MFYSNGILFDVLHLTVLFFIKSINATVCFCLDMLHWFIACLHGTATSSEGLSNDHAWWGVVLRKPRLTAVANELLLYLYKATMAVDSDR